MIFAVFSGGGGGGGHSHIVAVSPSESPIPHRSATMANASALKMAVMLTVYCVAGTLMTLINKVLVHQFPFPNVAVALQNMATVSVLFLAFQVNPAEFGSTPKLDTRLVVTWAPLTLMFVGLLVSSLLALMHVSAVTLIVFRNLTSLTVAALEYAIIGTPISWESGAALVGMLVGAAMYAMHDLSYSTEGYAWLMANLVTTSMYQVWVKRVISHDGPKSMGPPGFSYVNNLFSLPVLAVIAAGAGELGGLSGYRATTPALVSLAASCGLACVLSVTAFTVNLNISATSMMVCNNVNKFAVIILSEVFIASTMDGVSRLGSAAVLLFGFWYARSRSRSTTKIDDGENEASESLVDSECGNRTESDANQPAIAPNSRKSVLSAWRQPARVGASA